MAHTIRGFVLLLAFVGSATLFGQGTVMFEECVCSLSSKLGLLLSAPECLESYGVTYTVDGEGYCDACPAPAFPCVTSISTDVKFFPGQSCAIEVTVPPYSYESASIHTLRIIDCGSGVNVHFKAGGASFAFFSVRCDNCTEAGDYYLPPFRPYEPLDPRTEVDF